MPLGSFRKQDRRWLENPHVNIAPTILATASICGCDLCSVSFRAVNLLRMHHTTLLQRLLLSA
ncbi:hypothetical protein EMIT0P12_20098 [Pseudomonas sp. IT-P12]